ncbi:MAG TPA: 5-(carboxyamino)imidazole ribonucleotide synthase [Chitinophagaceae bacterium]|nr:5-(carboxyamino)imidazole ribonucleotide synthase [Chitinophagaceae bacterium]
MIKAGILGGGQLGRMLLQAAANYPVETHVLENDADCPAAHLCHHFTLGDIRDHDAVYRFGKSLDIITVEIENVNVDALASLEQEGVTIIPQPAVLATIKNRILQKEYYRRLEIPTPEYVLTNNRKELELQEAFLPAVHKIGEGGYDGRGTQVIESKNEFSKGFDAPSILEKRIPIEKEIAQLIAINKKGEAALYPPVEMHVDPRLNLLDFQLCPAELEEKTKWKAEAIALAVVRGFHSPGIFAVEMFVDRSGNVLVNETAPRVHNSGHHTIEANYSSQFDMLWRIMLDYPLGNTDMIMSSVMINLLGSETASGAASYEGLEEVLRIENAFVHIYGKKNTRPGRKMGHVTILSKEKQELIHQSQKVRKTLVVKGLPSL